MLTDQRILITGGTGSFGVEAIPRFLANGAREIVVLSRDEYKQTLLREQHAVGGPVRCVIGDVRNAGRLKDAMRGVDVVIHAAAMKHVWSCEENPTEAVLTNVMGTWGVAEACLGEGVRKAVHLSADKAVMPIGVYGATKFLAERIFTVAACSSQATRFANVRYSNVLGSRGSVIELFRERLQRGETVSVFDPRLVRLVMTQGEVIDLVLLALSRMLGGEIFVKDCQAVTMIELAETMRDLIGSGRVEVRSDGQRSGERLDAVLISQEEASRTLRSPEGYFVILPPLSKTMEERYREHYRGCEPVAARPYGTSTASQMPPEDLRALLKAMASS